MLPYVILIAALAAIPPALGFNNYFVLIASLVLMYTTMVVAWNIIGGFAGQLDLAAGAYHGLGIFTTGILLIFYGLTPWIGILLGGLVAVGLALFVGYPTFRFGLRDVWFALSSFALVFILQKVFLVWESVGGTVERRLPRFESSWYYLRFPTYDVYYYLLAVIFIFALTLNIFVRRRKIGSYLLAIRENEAAAEMLGVNTQRYKLWALALYSFVTGLTGGIFVLIAGFVHPSLFDPWISIQTAVLGIVGGMGTIIGPPLTALLIVGFSEYLRVTLGGWVQGLHLVVYAIILMVIVLFRPEGLGPDFERLVGGVRKALGRGAK